MLRQQSTQTSSSMAPILVCAETHTATDNIALKLLAAVAQLGQAAGLHVTKEQILRVGDIGRVASELKR